MNIYKDVFVFDKKYENMSNEEIIIKFNKIWDRRMNLILKLTKTNDKQATYNLLNNKKHDEYIKLLQDLKIITPFPIELLNKMEEISILEKNLKQHFEDYTTRAYCFSMSVALSLIFENNYVINRGTICLPLINFEHQWLEHNNKVYDTTMNLIFPKDHYYQIYSPYNIQQLTEEEIDTIKNDIFKQIKKKNK